MRQRIIHALLSATLLFPLGLALNFALSVALARLLSVEEFGVFGFVYSLISVLAVVATLGFAQSMMRFTVTYVKNLQPEFFAGLLRFSLRAVFLSALAIAAVLGLAAAVSDTHTTGLFWTAMLLVPITIDVWRESTVRGLYRTAEAIAPRQIFLPLITLITILAFQIQDVTLVLGAYLAIAVAIEIAGLLRLKALAAPICESGTPKYDKSEWMKTSIPMALTSLGVQGMARWDLIIVGFYLGMEAAGLYAAASRIALLPSLFIRIINLALAPLFSETYHSKDRSDFRKLFIISTVGSCSIALPLFLIVVFFPNEILRIFGSEYESASNLLIILTTGQLVNLATGPCGIALNMSAYQQAVMRITLFASLLNLCLLFVLVPRFGVVGAAAATSGMVILMNILMFLKTIKAIRQIRAP